MKYIHDIASIDYNVWSTLLQLGVARPTWEFPKSRGLKKRPQHSRALFISGRTRINRTPNHPCKAAIMVPVTKRPLYGTILQGAPKQSPQY